MILNPSHLALSASLLLLLGCSSQLDPASVKAKVGAPISAIVEERRIPYDSSLPKYVVTVQLPIFPSWMDTSSERSNTKISGKGELGSLGGKISGDGARENNLSWIRQHYEYDSFTQMIGTQFVSALSAIENISIIAPGSLPSTKLQPGERGPFSVSAQITAAGSQMITDQSKLNALVIMQDEEVEEGFAEIDVQLAAEGRIITAFPVQGTYQYKRKKAGVGLIVPVYERERTARSIIENATRVALQEAAAKIFTTLREKTGRL